MMKNLLNYLIAFCFVSCSIGLDAQIAIGADDLPTLGTLQVVGNQGGAEIDLGVASDAVQTWNWSGDLNGGGSSLASFVDPSETEYAAEYPEAEMARVLPFSALIGGIGEGIFPDEAQATVYFNTDEDGNVYYVGGVVPILDFLSGTESITNLRFDPASLYLPVGTLGNTSDNTGDLFIPIPVEGIALELRVRNHKTMTADAFGDLILPDFNYETLRYQQTDSISLALGTVLPFIGFTEIDIETVLTLIGLNPEDLPFATAIFDTTLVNKTYHYLTKGLGYPLATVTYFENDSTGTETPISVEYAKELGTLVTNYDYSADCLEFNFDNNSEEAIAYIWDFGNGDSSTANNPNYSYPEEGTYEVTLTAFNFEDMMTVTQTIVVDDCIDITGIETPEALLTLQVYPNPAKTTVHVIFDSQLAMENTTIKIFNGIGQIIVEEDLLRLEQYDLSVSDWQTGVYFLNIYDEQGHLRAKQQFIVGQ